MIVLIVYEHLFFIQQFKFHYIIRFNKTQTQNIEATDKVGDSGGSFYLNTFHRTVLKSCCTNNISKNARCCYISTCACTFNNQGLFNVAVSVKQYNVILSVQVIEIVVTV